MKALNVLGLFFFSLTSICAQASQFYSSCEGERYTVTIEQGSGYIRKNSQSSRVNRMIELTLTSRYPLDFTKGVQYSSADFLVVRRSVGQPDDRGRVSTVVDIYDDSGSNLLEEQIPCQTDAYHGRDH